MATVEEILADPAGAVDLPDGAIPLHAIVVIEYAEPGSDVHPARSRIGFVSDDDLTPWSSMGMMHFAIELEQRAVRNIDDD